MPTPVRFWLGLFPALLATESVALAVPEVCGENDRVTGTLCPAEMVTGKEIPLSENSELFKLADETVTLAPPALMLLDWLAVVPTVTLPKFSAMGATISCPGAVPVPESGTLNVELDALELMVIPPVAFVADCGAKIALKVTLAPGLRTSGKLRPLMLNPAPATVACEIVTLEPPVFVSESIKVTLAPTCTLPKARLAGLATS